MRQLTLTLCLLLLGLPAVASAITFDLTLFQNGNSMGQYDQDFLGCSQAGKGYVCAGGGLVRGDLSLDDWDLFLDPDPIVAGTATVTNIGSTTQQFTLQFDLVTGAQGPSTLVGGNISGTLRDNNGDGAALNALSGGSIYDALIDGTSVATMYDFPFSETAGGFGIVPLTPDSFGTPIPSMAGPAVTNLISIILDFNLSPGDSVAITSNFIVVPVPEPGTAALLGLGITALAAARRRSA